MRQSELFINTRREAPKDEVSINAQLLIRAGFIDKLMAGVYTFLPLGFRVLKKIENIIRKEMEEISGVEILMPVLHPKANWDKTERWNSYDSLFRFTSFHSKNDYVLGPTHEEVIVPLVKKFNLSYKDFPLAIFQIQNKFRDEVRAKSGLLRGREFLMKDLYSFHASEDDLDRYYEKVKQSYFKIFKELGLGHITYLTFASGGTFSKYSHEFQTLTQAGEDTIHICKKCDLAVNNEIISEQSGCPECGTGNLEMEKAVEVGNIFKLKTKYSQPFGLKFKNQKGLECDVLMGCYGIGLSRLMGTIVEAHHDDGGIVWPQNTAPFQLHLLEIGELDDDLKKFAENVYNTLARQFGLEVLYDDRRVSSGEKFADADLIGFPWRVVVSEKLAIQGKIEVKKRDEAIVNVLKVEEFAKSLK